MKEILNRLKGETPLFFKRLRAFGLSLSSVGITVVAIPNIPPTVTALATKAIWIGALVAALAQLTVKDPAQL